MSSKKLSLCIALGAVLGIFPVLGTTTVLCAAAAFALRLNPALIQAVNYGVYPLQLILLPFFYGAGTRLFHNQSERYSGKILAETMQYDMWGSLTAFLDSTLAAVSFWMLAGPLLVLLIYSIMKSAIRRLMPGPHSPPIHAESSE